MDPLLTRLGYRCDLCLAYRPNVAQNLASQGGFWLGAGAGGAGERHALAAGRVTPPRGA